MLNKIEPFCDKSENIVFFGWQESTCTECNKHVSDQTWMVFKKNSGIICLSCAQLDHLIFLPSGDTALTRRAQKHSTLSAIVLKWNPRRKRYERQGLLVESVGLEKAKAECLADKEKREQRRERDACRREKLDQEYVKDFARVIRKYYPGCPAEKEFLIAEHACLKYSGRVGRTARAKAFSPKMIRLAVIAHIRHIETDYDDLLANGYRKKQARTKVEENILHLLQQWQENL